MELYVSVPKGYEVDKEATEKYDGADKVIIKRSAVEMVDSVADLPVGEAFAVSKRHVGDMYNRVLYSPIDLMDVSNIVCYPTEEDAVSAHALVQLLHLRKHVIGDWKMSEAGVAFCIGGTLQVDIHYAIQSGFKSRKNLSFPTRDMANQFLVKYRSLIKDYTQYKG